MHRRCGTLLGADPQRRPAVEPFATLRSSGMMQRTPGFPRDSEQELRVPIDALRQFVVGLLVHKGMFEAEARIAADRMVEADARGTYSHGTWALKRYLDAMDAGDIDPRAQVLTLREGPSTAALDGGNGLGHVAATRGMQLAIRKARETGVGAVTVVRGQHYGAASVYALLAARDGLIGLTTTNTGSPTVAGYGSRQALTANNALAWACPVRNGPPIVLDMAVGETSWGKIAAHRLYGLPIPEKWAWDAEGRSTTDPNAATTILPAAGARGFGLAVMCGVFSGVLAGGRFATQKKTSPFAAGSEHFFLALDPEHFTDRETYFDEIDRTIQAIRAAEPADGFDRVRVPGEPEAEHESQAVTEGIPLHRDHAAELAELAAAAGIEVPW
ncbi:MAG: Ldh family oxidoreductase [Planctomycetota bacterium]|nr:MAG: Ldh family oxidoreductase [Planctomycetota bacterium]